MSAWEAGASLGPYTLLAPLGAGGMGEVWKARDTRLDRMVAVKRLKGQHSARFEREARSVAALNHPHICQIHDVGPDYLVLEYIDGAPIRGPLAPEEAVRLSVQIATALEEAHKKGILHRDLKPANIMVTAAGAAKLLDFGLAKLRDSADPEATRTIEGTVLGTAAYMAPEQAQGQPLDERSDIFSFGAVLYELFSGHRAFPGEHSISTLAAVIHKEPEPLQAAPDIVRIVMRCLRKSPAERFQSMAEVRAALETADHRLKPAPQQQSIAVLPFANMSLDKEQEFFSDGLAEEIINALAQIPDLKVTARTSAFAFRGKDQDIRRIAEALDVRTILEGSVRRAGNRIRVTAQLINAADGYHLWSQRYDRELADVFEVQDEIAAAIAAALQVKLAPKPAAAARHKPSLPAYEAYLKARHHSLSVESWELAKQYFEQAIALDSSFALAYSALGGHYAGLAVLGMRPSHELMPQARSWLTRALEFDPGLPEAHAHLGMMAVSYDYDRNEAERQFRLALAREPVSPEVRLFYGVYLLGLDRPLEAAEQIQHGLREDPLSRLHRLYLALSLWVAGKDSEMESQARHLLELDEHFPFADMLLGIYYGGRGELDKARTFAERAYRLAPQVMSVAGAYCAACVQTGDIRRAEEVINSLGAPDKYGVPRVLVYFWLARGDFEKAADWWEKMIDQRDPGAVIMCRLPYSRRMRQSPRWPALAKRMNLPE